MIPDPLQESPDLSVYREFVSQEMGCTTPLPHAATAANGLFELLPKLADDSPEHHLWPWNTAACLSVNAYPANCPEIFVAMPSYNQGKFIEAAIRSVLLQNYPKLTFVLFDADSNDQTQTIIEKYRECLSFVRIGADRGQGHAINMAFSLANNSGLLGWLNSDDMYLPGALSRVATEFCRDPNVDFLYGDGVEINEDCSSHSLQCAGVVHPSFRRYPGTIFSHSAFWSTRVHQPIWEQLECAVDYELWIRILPECRRIRYLPYPLGAIRVHHDAKSHDPALVASWENDKVLNGQRHRHLYGPDPIRRLAHRLVNRFSRSIRISKLTQNAATTLQKTNWPQAESQD
tara:strand:+ start:11677 stop:12711 length:1035 start_codon:yes stop_codon:yes gene_type:complete